MVLALVAQLFYKHPLNLRSSCLEMKYPSPPVLFICGVLQGSSLGPLQFILFTVDLPGIIQRHELTPHLSMLTARKFMGCVFRQLLNACWIIYGPVLMRSPACWVLIVYIRVPERPTSSGVTRLVAITWLAHSSLMMLPFLHFSICSPFSPIIDLYRICI